MTTINYKSDFYDAVRTTSDPSAKVVVPLIMQLVQPKTVADVGCGSGAWLNHFQKLGCKILGFDGPWVEESQLLISKDDFIRVNLESGIEWNETFDLVISLEVAEHLPENAADVFVASLCKMAPVIFFSAAIPGQGGTNHLNEQWQSYWIEKFKERGFECYDAIRPRIWHLNEVAVHYCQNCFIFARMPINEVLLAGLKNYEIQYSISDVVHPRVLSDKTGPLSCSFRKFFFQFLPLYLKIRLGMTK